MPGRIREGPWDLNRKGSIDQERHMKRLKDAIMAQLPTIVAHTPIITEPGSKTVRVPVKVLELPRFRHREPESPAGAEGAGQGEARPGDIVASVPRSRSGGGQQPADAPGTHVIEVEMDLDALQELIFEDLALPRLHAKLDGAVSDERVVWNSRRRHGPLATVDLKATLKAALARSAAQGTPGRFTMVPDDLRFRSYEVEQAPITDAVVFLLRDASGSMDDEKKYLSRSLAFWLVRWLRQQYRELKLEFWLHDSEAHAVNEEEFFGLSSAGGTRAASAYEAMARQIEARYPASRYNVYGFHFTDGEDWAPDVAARALERMLPYLSLFALIELNPHDPGRGLSEFLRRLPNPPVVTTIIEGREQVLSGLHQILRRR
ncbi:MAG: DUF444 family protein [Actinomycetia bacterium]|nr:DUF444 family protein [Actinomycetes bacterium]